MMKRVSVGVTDVTSMCDCLFSFPDTNKLQIPKQAKWMLYANTVHMIMHCIYSKGKIHAYLHLRASPLTCFIPQGLNRTELYDLEQMI